MAFSLSASSRLPGRHGSQSVVFAHSQDLFPGCLSPHLLAVSLLQLILRRARVMMVMLQVGKGLRGRRPPLCQLHIEPRGMSLNSHFLRYKITGAGPDWPKRSPREQSTHPSSSLFPLSTRLPVHLHTKVKRQYCSLNLSFIENLLKTRSYTAAA